MLSPAPYVVSPEKSGRELDSFLPMLSTPRGMITSAYFFVCKTARVMETVTGELPNKRQFYSKKKLLKPEIECRDGGFMLWCCKLKFSVSNLEVMLGTIQQI